jgi:hypothetical protein
VSRSRLELARDEVDRVFGEGPREKAVQTFCGAMFWLAVASAPSGEALPPNHYFFGSLVGS